MSKAVLISIRQEWCQKIMTGQTKEPCECGGKCTARAFLDDRVRSSCDKEDDHA